MLGGGEVTSGTFSPCLERGIGMAYVSTARAAEGTPIEIDVRGRVRPAVDRAQASVPKGSVSDMADPSYPDDLKYHPEHDWARIDGDTNATFGITWYAQDALGEVVFFDAPDIGAEITKDQPYTEVESVKAVSDVFAPLSGEVTAVNEALADKPETINEDPYGEGWLVKVKLSDPSEVDSLMDSAEYQATPRLNRTERSAMTRYTSVTDADLSEMLGDDRRRLDRRAVRGHPRRRCGWTGRCRSAPACPSRRCTRSCARSPPRARRPRTRCRSSAPGCTTTTCRR